MNQNPAKNTQTRPLDPNVLQGKASNPASNVWVNASAGSGKTKVLTDRVLRLLLPDANDQKGSPAHTILCLTFTKAAATEMLARIHKTLGDWTIATEQDLKDSLKKLLGTPATVQQCTAARSLFTAITDTPGGLKIMTIHAFCQSTLGRFPLEADISPQATPIEESDAATLLQTAQSQILKDITTDKGSPENAALTNIASAITEDQFFALLQKLTDERHQLAQLLKHNFGHDGLYTALCQACNVQPNLEPQTLIQQAFTDKSLNRDSLLHAAQTLLQSKNNGDQSRGQTIADFLALPESVRPEHIDTYSLTYLTKDDSIRKTIATKPALKQNPEIEGTLLNEAERLQTLRETLKTIHSTALTRDLLRLCDTIITRYETLKQERNALDYNDLIIKTLSLMENFPGWIMYKLDSGIDHILVDEAQDTNPEQWKIIEKLCDEFYTHNAENTPSRPRTVFVVGDDKQSIYSFQRAAPEEFARMHKQLRQKTEQAGQHWEDVQLSISFRSAEAILNAVDAVFANENTAMSSAHTPTNHNAYRRGEAGHVELWPLFENDEDSTENKPDIWTPPVTAKDTQSGSLKLANTIATCIRTWLDTNEQLAARNRAIEPRDIMILVKSRSTLTHQIIRALKAQNIPTGGLDRITLNTTIAVQDLIALAKFSQIQGDDLTLACFLKSPLIGMSENQLFTLAHNRKSTLWQALQDSNEKAIIGYLKDCIHAATQFRPYEFFTYILNTPCPTSQISGLTAIKNRLGEDSIDPINELLTMALDYEQNHIPDLSLFCNWLTSDNKTIKRETEDTANHVRIMTIHGAKGLQAPIVIMPDTIINAAGKTGASDRLLMPDKTNLPVPLWTPRKNDEHTLYKQAKTTLKNLAEQEYNRLLYVAMTRAEDRLYIAGHTGKTKPQDTSWYFKIKTALENHPKAQTDTNGHTSLSNPQTKDPKPNQPHEAITDKKTDIPDWLFTPAPEEQQTQSFAPSGQSTKPSTTKRTPHQANLQARQRGIIAHKLLEILPALPPENREQAAQNYLQITGSDLPESLQQNILQQTLTILNDPTFCALFRPEALAEIPITGKMPDGTIINGIIDRLLITDNAIWLIDYKTGQIPDAPPPSYQKQMQAYATALRQIQPGKPIHAALLWTEGPALMPVNIDEGVD